MASTATDATNVVELSAQRARRNLRALAEAKHRHPSAIGRRMTAARPAEACRVLQFRTDRAALSS